MRKLAIAGAVMALSVSFAPAAFAQDSQDCDTARTAYDEAVAALKARATELGVADGDFNRLRVDIEDKGRDGVIDEAESAELLRDPVVLRIATDFQQSDLNLIQDLARTSNDLLRCDDDEAPPTGGAGETTTTAPPTTAAAPVKQLPPGNPKDLRDCEDYPNQAAAQAVFDRDETDPNDLDADGDGIACEDFFADDDTADAPVGGIETGDGSTSV